VPVGAVLDKQLETFERNGLGLPKEEREKLKALKKSTRLHPLHFVLKIAWDLSAWCAYVGMSELCIQFQQNINEDKTSREFTKEELAGMPDDFIENLGKSEDGQKYVRRCLWHFDCRALRLISNHSLPC
jgi:thimet oligopeptidase